MARVCVAGVRPYHLVDGALHEAVEAAGAVLAIGQQASAWMMQPPDQHFLLRRARASMSGHAMGLREG